MVLTIKELAEDLCYNLNGALLYTNPTSQKPNYTSQQISDILKDLGSWDAWLRTDMIDVWDSHGWDRSWFSFYGNYEDQFYDLADSSNPQVVNLVIDGTDVRIKLMDMATTVAINFRTNSDSSISSLDTIDHSISEGILKDSSELYVHFADGIQELTYFYIMKHLYPQAGSQPSPQEQSNVPIVSPSLQPSAPSPAVNKPKDPYQRLIDTLNQERNIDKHVQDYNKKYKAEVINKLMKIANKLDELKEEEISGQLDHIIGEMQ